MACDRFVYWKNGKKPTKDEVAKVLTNFFAGGAESITWEMDRFFVTLHGNITHPLTGIEGALVHPSGREAECRWIEVHLARTNLDVITRQSDEFTNCLAGGLARLFARFWEGELEE
jgi:hypothetical protein